MSEHGVPEGAVSREDIARLAVLFDRFEYAFEPLSIDAKEAESQFEDLVLLLYNERVKERFASVTFSAFRCKIRSLCREHLRKNPL